MKIKLRSLVVTSMLFGISGITFSDDLFTVGVEQLEAKTLFDQTLSENGLITVKPMITNEADGDVEILNQCLWSVKVDFDQGSAVFAPGKMICVGPHQEVLESIPSGTIKSFGACTNNACDSFQVAGDITVIMTLDQPLGFNVQARNERK